MRVAFVISGLFTGGAEIMLYKLLKTLSREQWEPLVICLGGLGRPADLIESLGVPIVPLSLNRSVTSYLRAPFRVRSALSHFRPELIAGWMAHGNIAAWAISKTLGIPLVWNIRQTLDLPREKPLTRRIIGAAAHLSRRPKRIIYVSPVAREQHHRMGYEDRNARVLPNGFDLEVFHRDEAARARVRRELGVSDSTRVIGHLGRYHPMKDHLGLLRAARAVVADEPDVLVVLAGSGVDRRNSELSGTIRQYALYDNVKLLGETPHPEAFLSACDIFCLSSAWGEGFPNAVGEAMACELPCVVTDVGDSSVLVDSTGLSVAPAEPNALAAALLELVRLEPAERRQLGMRARLRIRDHYSLGSIAVQYARVFHEAVSAH